MSKIIVPIDSSVTEEQRRDPRFLIFCDAQRGFGLKYQQLLALHEGAQSYFAKKAASTDVKFYGPTMHWDSRPQYDCPAISRSSCAWTIHDDTIVIDALKAHVAGYVCRREMLSLPGLNSISEPGHR